MPALLKLIVFGFLFLSVIFIIVSFRSRAARRRDLEKEWIEEGSPGDKDAYIRFGLKQYDQSLRARAIWLIYIIPVVAVAAIIYVTNFA